MRRFTTITCSFLLLSAFTTACKSKDEKTADDVAKSRGKVVEKTNPDKTEVDKARADFIDAMDKRLALLDQRIAETRTNVQIDQSKLSALRAEATALRAKVADQTQPWADDFKATFERIVNDIDAELNHGGTAPTTAPGNPTTAPATTGSDVAPTTGTGSAKNY